MEMLMILLPTIGVYAAIFVLLVFIIKKMLLSDTMKAVGTIKQVEADVRKKEEAIRMEIDVHEKEFAQKKSDAERELEDKRKKSEQEVSQMRDHVIAEAKQEGEKIITQAKKNEKQFREQLAQDMEEKAVDYAGQVFDLVISEHANEELNKLFINELLDALDEVDAGAITVDGDSGKITASHPVAEEQRSRLESLLKNKFGSTMAIEEVVDEQIMGGLILKLGSLEIDGSLRNRFEEAVAEVKKSA